LELIGRPVGDFNAKLGIQPLLERARADTHGARRIAVHQED
jgi:hypothetical protein